MGIMTIANQLEPTTIKQNTPLYGEHRPILKAAFMRTESEL